MGRIVDFYAVDIPPLERFLSLSIAQVFKFIFENSGKEPFLLRRESQSTISCKKYLEREESFYLKHLLRDLSACPSVNWVESLYGCKRFWTPVDSLFDWLEGSQALRADEYAQYELLFTKALPGASLGRLATKPQFQLSDLEFPVIPRWDINDRMGVWNAGEVDTFVLYTDFLLGLMPRFRTPAVAKNLDEDIVNDWVHEMLGSLLKVKTPSFTEPNVVSFVSY